MGYFDILWNIQILICMFHKISKYPTDLMYINYLYYTSNDLMYLSKLIYILFFSDFVIKVIDIDSSNSRTYSGHEAPVLSVALDPQEEFVVSDEKCSFGKDRNFEMSIHSPKS